jgi:hypothetical protein
MPKPNASKLIDEYISNAQPFAQDPLWSPLLRGTKKCR